MYLFAHVFSGCLIGLLFWHLSGDRRAFPVCIAGTLIPDIIDKPLAVLLPGVFGSTRTLGHTLFVVVILGIAGLWLWRYRDTILGFALAGAVFSHQVFDSIWNLPGTWYFPLLGPFPVIIVPDYIQQSILLEISSPSELVFACASGVLLMGWYLTAYEENLLHVAIPRTNRWLQVVLIFILGGMGVYLIIAGLNQVPVTVFAPAYGPLTSLMAGTLAALGAFFLLISDRIPGFRKAE